MEKIILLIILSMLIIPGAGAAEIFGQISTNPKAPAGGGDNPPGEQPSNPPEIPAIKPSGGALILPAQNRSSAQPKAVQPTTVKPKVLGLKIYPDGSLLRGADQKIYFIEGRVKKQIVNLAELNKYRGRAILEATAEDLAGYQLRGHLDGELIRQKGDVKVYVIKQGLKQHILNLEELREHYFGLEIFNLSREQMAWYQEIVL